MSSWRRHVRGSADPWEDPVVERPEDLPEPELGDAEAPRPRPAHTEADEEELRRLVDEPEEGVPGS